MKRKKFKNLRVIKILIKYQQLNLIKLLMSSHIKQMKSKMNVNSFPFKGKNQILKIKWKY